MNFNRKKTKLTRKERRYILRKTVASLKAQDISNIIIMAIIVPLIKGKLGFNIKTNDGKFLFISKAIHKAFVDDVSGFFSVAFSMLATFATQITAFETAVDNMSSKAPGTEGLKTEAKVALYVTLLAALAYVNQICRSNQAIAEAVISEARMALVPHGSKNKQDFSVKQGPGATEATLSSLAPKNEKGKYVSATYEWQYSIDNGTTWIALPSSHTSKTVATGMPLRVIIMFRKRVTTKKGGTGNWSGVLQVTLGL